ncbi:MULTISPECIES: response regulator [Microvirga]|uniref:histidine kinase n=1 Tax=Microvirga TaxID=186650 RepID=UPI00361286F1
MLVTEDDAIIGFDLTDALDAAGYAIAGPTSTCTAALAWLNDNAPDLAVLDVTLKDGPSTEIARVLRSRGIPFVVYSGRRQCEAAPEFREALWLEKPSAHRDLLCALHQLLARSEL